MRAIFSLTFGASVYLLVDRLSREGAGADAADIHYRRMLWLMLFGNDPRLPDLVGRRFLLQREPRPDPESPAQALATRVTYHSRIMVLGGTALPIAY